VTAIAVDGKTLRGTCDETGQGVHLLAAMTHDDGIVVSQQEVDGKANEVRREALCRIPNSVRRDSEDSSWVRWLTRSRKVMGTKACHEYRRSRPDVRGRRAGEPA
jgi:hypothetical protein